MSLTVIGPQCLGGVSANDRHRVNSPTELMVRQAETTQHIIPIDVYHENVYWLRWNPF